MKTILICFLILLCSFQTARSQQKVYMPFFELNNIHEDYQYSLARLFQKYVSDQKNYEILLPEWKNEPYPSESKDTTQSRARETGAPFFIKGNLNQMGELIIVTITMYSTGDGAEVWNAFLKAAGMNDLDPILLTCAKNLGKKNVTTTADDIYTVTEQEGKELTELETKICGGFLIGGFYGFGQSVCTGFGFHTTYDNRSIIYGLDISSFVGGDNTEAHIAITIDHPFSNSANTGFAGGGLGYGTMDVANDDPNLGGSSNSGLTLMGGGGYIINRPGSVRLIFGSRLVVPLFRVDDKIVPGINFYMVINISKRARRKKTIDVNVNNTSAVIYNPEQSDRSRYITVYPIQNQII